MILFLNTSPCNQLIYITAQPILSCCDAAVVANAIFQWWGLKHWWPTHSVQVTRRRTAPWRQPSSKTCSVTSPVPTSHSFSCSHCLLLILSNTLSCKGNAYHILASLGETLYRPWWANFPNVSLNTFLPHQKHLSPLFLGRKTFHAMVSVTTNYNSEAVKKQQSHWIFPTYIRTDQFHCKVCNPSVTLTQIFTLH